MKFPKLLWFCFFWLLVPALGAENIHTLQDCYQAALKRSEVLATQAELVVQAEEHYQQALGNILPSISGQAAYLRQASGDGTASSTEQYYTRVSATQPLFRGFREYAALYQTSDLISAQAEAKQWASIQLYQDMAQAFYNVLATQKDLEQLDTQIDLYSKRIRDLQARVAIGRSRPSEVLTVQTAQAILQAQRQQSAGQWEVAREILAFLTGLDQGIILQDLTTDLPSPPLLDIYLAQLENRPDILAAKQYLVASQRGVAIARGAHWPSLDLNGNYYLNRSQPQQNVNWDAQIVLTLPLFMGRTVLSKTREAESVMRQNELALSRVTRLASEDVRNHYCLLQSDLAQLKILESAQLLAQKNYQAELRDYNLGLVNNLDVLQALSSYQDTVRSVVHMHYTIQNDSEQLEALVARRLPPPEGK